MTGNMNLRWRAKYGRIPSHVPIACNKFPQSLKPPPPPWPANQSMTSGYSTASNQPVTAKACVWWLCDWYVFSELFLLHMHHLTLLNISWSSTTNGSCGSGQTRAGDHLIYVCQPGTRTGTERKGSYKQGNSIVYYYYPTDSSVPRKWLA